MESTAGKTRITEEYRTFRDGQSAVPLEGWTVLHLIGPDTGAFLQGLASQDLPAGASRRAYFLTEKGRPLALAWVWVAVDGASAWAVADERAGDALLPHFDRFRVMEDVEFEDASPRIRAFGVAGGSVGVVLAGEEADRSDLVRIETEPLSIVLAPLAPSPRVRLADPAVFEPWRIAAGLPRGGVDFDLDRIATELGDPGAISLTKGCYVGQEVVARTSNRGQVRRRRIAFRFEGETGPLPPKTEIRAAGAAVGHVTSSALEPGSGEGVGMGYVGTEALSGGADLIAVQDDTTILLRPSPESLVPS